MFRAKFFAVALLVVVAATIPSTCRAQFLEKSWTYSELWEKSDCVVIATLTRIETTTEVEMNGPGLVQFDIGSHGNYLMFLVRERDGRYAPTEGQTDPSAHGIRRLGAAPR